MYILGISCFYHDNAACIVRDGDILAAAQEERFSRKKHDPRFPRNAITYCLDETDIAVRDLDCVVYYDKPFLTFERLLLSYLIVVPRKTHTAVSCAPRWTCWSSRIASCINKTSPLGRKPRIGAMDSNSTDPREIRRFGIIVFFFFGSLCALAVWKQKPIPTCLFGLLWFLGVCFLLFPSRTGPLYAGWLSCAHFVGRVVTALTLTLAYFLVITPAAWLKRVFGGRPLPVKPDREASSYWVEREEAAQPRERFLKRF